MAWHQLWAKVSPWSPTVSLCPSHESPRAPLKGTRADPLLSRGHCPGPQMSKAVGLTWVTPAPWQCLEPSVVVTVLGVSLLACHGCRPGMLLNTWQGMGHPQQRPLRPGWDTGLERFLSGTVLFRTLSAM